MGGGVWVGGCLVVEMLADEGFLDVRGEEEGRLTMKVQMVKFRKGIEGGRFHVVETLETVSLENRIGLECN